MKRKFIVFILISLFLIPVNILAEENEIDCANNPYACVKCTYKVGNGSNEITFQAWSDGTKTQISQSYNFTPGVNYNPTVESNVFSKNFEMDSNNKFKCPTVLYWTARQSGYSGIYTISFDKKYIEDNYKSLFQSELLDSYNNDKVIYKDNNKMLSCTYSNNITIKSDGEIMVIENKSGKLLSITSDGDVSRFVENNTTQTLENFSGAISPSDFLDDDGNLSEICPEYYIRCINPYNSCSIMSEKGPNSSQLEGGESLNGDDIQTVRDLVEGRTFLKLLGQLKNPLVYGDRDFSGLTLRIGNNDNATLNDVTANNGLCSRDECMRNNEYYIDQGLKNVVAYCNTFYSNYATYMKTDDKNNYELRMKECISFSDFYKKGVENNIFNDYTNNCGIISEEFRLKIYFILNIIKVAGPLLALGLGTLDFIKTVASGDADKEMKNAFKRFSTRLIAAVLLFLIPFILGFLMDTFIGNEDGYNEDNPFCGIVDWGE